MPADKGDSSSCFRLRAMHVVQVAQQCVMRWGRGKAPVASVVVLDTVSRRARKARVRSYRALDCGCKILTMTPSAVPRLSRYAARTTATRA